MHPTLRTLILAAALASGAAAAAGPMNDIPVIAKAKAALEGVFQKKGLAGKGDGDRSSWSVGLSPVFPASWPPGGACVVYGYARAFGFHLSDAELAGGLWAEARIAGGEVRVENVREAVKELGPQGFRPIGKDDPAITLHEVAQRKVLAARSLRDLDDEVRRFYCQWRSYNGVIAREIEPLQKPFFEWLGCK